MERCTLRHQFHLGLSENLKDELTKVGVPNTLEALITLAIQIDRRLRERRTERATQPNRPIWMTPRAPSPAYRMPHNPAPNDPEPIQIGLICPALTPEEHLRLRQRNLCLYCEEAGHYVHSCPAKLLKFPTTPQVKLSSLL